MTQFSAMDAIKEFVMENQLWITIFLAFVIAGISMISMQARSAASVISEDSIDTKNNIPTFLIIGPSNSGKTSFFLYLSQLATKGVANSEEKQMKFTDMEVSTTTKSFKLNINNEFYLPLLSEHKLKYTVMDIPGEEKIFRMQINPTMSNFKQIKGAIFMIDAALENKSLNAVARQLFDFLMLSEKRSGGVDVLLAINKSEQFGARPTEKIRDILEKEIDVIKDLKLKSLKKVNLTPGAEDEPSESEEIIDEFGGKDIKFKFERLEGSFDLIPGSLHKNDVQKWLNWIDERSVN